MSFLSMNCLAAHDKMLMIVARSVCRALFHFLRFRLARWRNVVARRRTLINLLPRPITSSHHTPPPPLFPFTPLILILLY